MILCLALRIDDTRYPQRKCFQIMTLPPPFIRQKDCFLEIKNLGKTIKANATINRFSDTTCY